jgi:NitT/TauT family transport system permease protein
MSTRALYSNQGYAVLHNSKKIALGAGGGLIILILWYFGAEYVRAVRVDLPQAVVRQLYPLPQQVVTVLFEIPVSDILQNVAVSTARVLLGFLAAAMIAVPLGFAIGRFYLVACLAEPSNDFLRYLPVAGFTSLAIFLIGTGNGSAILVVFLGTVFHLTVAVADAARRVPHAYIDLAQTMNLSGSETMGQIVVPAALPAVYDNLRISLGWAWSYVTLAEVMGTTGGLGHAIEISRRYIRTDQVLFWMILIGILGLISDQVVRRVGSRLFRWATGAVAF